MASAASRFELDRNGQINPFLEVSVLNFPIDVIAMREGGKSFAPDPREAGNVHRDAS